jgi:hypothetical protein
MLQDLVLPTAGEMPTVSYDSAPATGAHDTHDSQKILATDVDPTIRAPTEKNTTQLVLPTEEFKQSDLSFYLRSYVESNSRPSATEQLLGPLARIDPIMIEPTIETELQEISKGKLINKIMDFDSNGDKLLEVSTESAQRLWSALKVRLPSKHRTRRIQCLIPDSQPMEPMLAPRKLYLRIEMVEYSEE